VSIDPVSGLATAHAAGTATITAVSGRVHAATMVHVPTVGCPKKFRSLVPFKKSIRLMHLVQHQVLYPTDSHG